MSDFDVSLRLRLVNQLSRPAEEAERDLKDLQKAAEQLGRGKGGANLAGDLQQVGKEADAAKAKISGITAEANDSKLAIQRIGDGFGGFRADADNARQSVAGITTEAGEARQAIGRIGAEAGEIKGKIDGAEQAIRGIGNAATDAKQAVGRIGDGALDGLKADAQQAEQAIRQIGDAADQQRNKLRALGTGQGPLGHGGPIRPGGGLMTTAEGAIDQFGLPLAIGAGGAYLAGAAPAAIAVGAGAAIKAAAGDEYRSDQMRDTGEYSAEDQARYDRLLGQIGARHGIGTAKAQETFGALISNGMNNEDAASVTDTVVKVAKATEADPVDIANTSVRLQSIMGVKPEQMGDAYNALALGAKFGNFEMKDMAAHGPSMFAAMAAQGSTGLPAVRLTSAISQSIAAKSGSSDQAKTSFEAMLTDMVSPDVAERLKETYGKNIYQIRKDAIAAGKDPTLESIRVYHDAVGGDEEKTRSLFRNSEAYKGYAAVFGDLDLIIERMDKMKNAEGTIDAGYKTRTDNLNSQADRLTAGIAKGIKDLAAPLLPFLTQAARVSADQLENAGERKSQNDDEFRNEMSGLRDKFRYDPEADEQRRKEALAAAPEHARRLRKFLFGVGADPDFDARKHFGIQLRGGNTHAAAAGTTDTLPGKTADDLGVGLRPSAFGQAASEGMGAYNEALQAEGQKAEAEAQSIAERIKSWLGFTVSPTISPTYIPPAGAPAAPTGPGPQTSTQSSINNSTYNVTSPNPQHAALRTRRAQEREIRRAQAGSFHDTGRRLA